MAVPGLTTTANAERVSANLLKLARARSGLSHREIAGAAGVPQSTIARIESGAMQPTFPLLYRLLAAADLEPRVRLEPYDDHDDVLDRLAQQDPSRQTDVEAVREELLEALHRAG